MSTGLAVFDTTVQETNEWLKLVQAGLPPCDRQQAYEALRAVLHELRDRLPIDGVMSLSAQPPMLLRGVFLEGWRRVPVRFAEAESKKGPQASAVHLAGKVRHAPAV